MENACEKGRKEREINDEGKAEKAGSAHEKREEENEDGDRRNGKCQKRENPKYLVRHLHRI